MYSNPLSSVLSDGRQAQMGGTSDGRHFLDPIDEYEINVIIDNLNAMKPPGFVSRPIPTRLIIDAKYIISPHLTRIINASLISGKYPDLLKVARVTPLHKAVQNLSLLIIGQFPYYHHSTKFLKP